MASYRLGLLLTSLSPMTLAFWFIAVPALAGELGGGGVRSLLILGAGVFLATAAWVIGFCGVLSVLGSGLPRRAATIADTLGGLLLLLFAAGLAKALPDAL